MKLPEGHNKLLILSCCAPCSGPIIKSLAESKIDFTIFFYNPNIHPKEEYEKRKEENKRYAKKLGVNFVDGDYDVGFWDQKTKGLENEPERGKRCSECFRMRLEKTARQASEMGLTLYSSTLGISRWKDFEQVNAASDLVQSEVLYWKENWRKNGGGPAMYEISKKEGFYLQEYCGCRYSLK